MAEKTPDGLRIGHAERDQTIALLREHTAAGRLDLDEFEERVGHVTRARTNADLGAVLVDLPDVGSPRQQPAAARTSPPPHTSAPYAWSPHRARGRHGPLPGWVKLSLVMVAIWAMAGFGYFWPVWIIVPVALASLGNCGRNRNAHHEHHRVSA